MAKSSPEEIGLEKIRKSSHSKFKVAVTDIDGVLRGKYIHRDKLESALEGAFGFCNVVLGWDAADVCYDNASYTGWHTGYPDALVRLDPGTYREVPWDGGVPFLLGEFIDEHGHPLAICPRQLLKRVLARASEAGFDVLAAFEYEFFHFRETPQTLAEGGYQKPEPISPGMFGYSLLRLNQSKEYVNALFDELASFGVPIEGLHTETGPGVMEAAILYSEALEAADRAVLFKASAKEIGHRFGIMPSFMAKWRSDLPGCSGHIHQSLWNAGKKNAFHGGAGGRSLSRTFEHYVAGQLHCLPEILPLFAPTINSYKRLVEGAWAPTKANWGIDNRTTALRAIPGSKKSTRLETRVNGSDSNPYLALAAAVASGLYGIEHELELGPPVTGSGYDDRVAPTLPRNLAEATERFAASELARGLFGDDFVAHFAATRRWEWRQFSKAVTDWELARYFEII
ncbi:MAG TPA: glutamine synthetase family protein [Polyangiaceae bacterium]|jgi:glutamine synthetase|nr:glutamine synthetase family protein [Polyangiaceae bacterium]